MKRYIRSSEEVKERYFINGFRESRRYFVSIGHFTQSEWNKLQAGEVVEKDGNEFYIEKVEF